MRARSVLAIATLALAVSSCGGDDDNSPNAVALDEPAPLAIGHGDPKARAAPKGVAALRQLPTLRPARAEGIIGSQGLLVQEWIHEVDLRVATFWQTELNSADFRYVAPKELIYTTDQKTQGCGAAAADEGPFYCDGDQTLYLPLTWFENSASKYDDAGVAIVLAHENAHHVQNLAHIFDRDYLTIQTELQADCLSGVWAHSVATAGQLEVDDIGQILGQTEAAGDRDGIAITDPRAHGTPALREKFFEQGFTAGHPASCPVPAVSEIR